MTRNVFSGINEQLVCNFTFVKVVLVFQSYQDDRRMTMIAVRNGTPLKVEKIRSDYSPGGRVNKVYLPGC